MNDLIEIPEHYLNVPKALIHATGFEGLTSRQNRLAMTIAGALHARKYEPESITVRFSVPDLMQNYPGNERHYDDLWADMKAVAGCSIESKIQDEEGELEKAFFGHIVASMDADFNAGWLEIDVPKRTMAMLHTPKAWAQISKAAWYQMQSKHAQRLYTLIADQSRMHNNTEKRTAKHWRVELDEFRQLMQIDPQTYPDFRFFNTRVLKPAIEEINALGLLNLVVDKRRRGRKIAQLIFSWKPKLGIEAQDTAAENDKPKVQRGKGPQTSTAAPPLFPDELKDKLMEVSSLIDNCILIDTEKGVIIKGRTPPQRDMLRSRQGDLTKAAGKPVMIE